MKSAPITTTALAGISLLAIASALPSALTEEAKKPSSAPVPTKSDDWKLSGPFVHENLAVFLVHGKEELPDAPILTLGEAIESKAVTVTETGDVNQLVIENHSDEYHVYIHPGDIIKGGKQDRTLPNGFLLTRSSGKVSVDSFCVEQGRWAKRSGEAVDQFGSSSKALASKELKLASKLNQSQGDVWRSVNTAQEKLTRSLGADVKASASASSYQLTLENKTLEKRVQDYIAAIQKAADRSEEGAIGMAFAINGEFNSADVFASEALFEKLWPKLLESAATEAIGERSQGEEKPAHPTRKSMLAAIEEAAESREARENLSGKNFLLRREADRSVWFETYADGVVAGASAGPKRLHFNVIGWNEEDRAALANREQSPGSMGNVILPGQGGAAVPEVQLQEGAQEPNAVPQSSSRRRGFLQNLFGR